MKYFHGLWVINGETNFPSFFSRKINYGRRLITVLLSAGVAVMKYVTTFLVIKCIFSHMTMRCFFKYLYLYLAKKKNFKLSQPELNLGCRIFRLTLCKSNSYTMGCPPVCGDNSQALASGLSDVQVDNRGIIILYHLHQCRPCTSRNISF